MNGRIPEHIFYSFRPKLASEAVQSIRKARSGFLFVPRLSPKVSRSGFLSEIPQPNHRIQTQTQRRSSFGPLALVRLRLLAAQKLFCIFERVFNGPSVVVTFQNLGSGHRQIGRKKKIVSFLASRVSADNQKHRFFRNGIPNYMSNINQSFHHFASLTELYLLPVVNIRYHLLWGGKALAFLARSASGFLSSFWRQIENLCVALYSRNEICLSHLFSSQRCIKAICNQSKQPFRQPLVDLVYHLHRQFYQGIAVLAVQSHIDRQPQRFAAPGRLDLQRQNHQIQSPRIDNAFLGRADSIPPITGSVDLSSTVVKQRIVEGNGNDSLGKKILTSINVSIFQSLLVSQRASGKKR